MEKNTKAREQWPQYSDRTIAGTIAISTDHTAPLQFFSQAQSRQLPPELNLLSCILEDAIDTITKKRVDKQIRDDAIQWIKSDETTWVFTFINICLALNLDPSHTRKRIDKLLMESLQETESTPPVVARKAREKRKWRRKTQQTN